MPTKPELTAVRRALAHYGKPIDVIARTARVYLPTMTMSTAIDCLDVLCDNDHREAEKSTNSDGPIAYRLKAKA